MTSPHDSPIGTTQAQEPPDFSLVLGGPLFQLARRTRLSGDGLEMLHRRVLMIVLVAWLPLLILSAIAGQAYGGTTKIPFLQDIEANVRFLVALPVLIVAELIVHLRISPLVRRFVERRIVVAEDLPRFNAAIQSALRVRNSVLVEVVLIVLVYSLGLWIWRTNTALESATWYARPEGTSLHLTLAGYWYVFVSLPIFQFILLRWYMRIGLWFQLLWRISRLNLRLSAAHPDRAGGLGFLGDSSYAFVPILFAQGALLAGMIADRVLYEGQALMSFKMQAGGFIGFFVLFVLGPLLMFAPMLSRAKRKGMAEYGSLATRYVFGFESRWIHGDSPDLSELLGTGDIQSLADLGNSYAVVREMRVVPFGLSDIGRLAAATAAPLVPLSLTIFSLEEVLTQLIKILL